MMSAGTVMTATPPVPRVDRASLLADRRFYVIAAYAMLILTAVGFRAFLLRGRGFGGGPMTSQIVPLVVVHGLAMFAWVVLFCVQSTLILRGNRRLHMVLGPLGGVLAAAIVILGSSVALLSVHFSADLYAPFGGARFFLAIMLSEMVLFGTFVAIGIANRHRAEIHRPMMLLATLAIISGSLGRIPYVVNLAILPPLYVYWPALLFGGVLFLLQWGMTRLANRWYLIGYAGIAVGSVVSVALGSTTLWSQMTASFVP
jgi:hypothetical protein